MPSPPLGSTLGQTTFGVACHHRGWATHTIERRRVLHDITSLGMHAWSDDVGRGITSPPLDSTLGRQRRAWHEITAFGQHTRSNDIRHDIPSSPLGSTHSQMTFGVACHYRGWAAHTIERRRAWHDITSLGMHAWSDDVGQGITSPALDSTLGRQRQAWHEITAFGQHTRSNDIGHGIPSSPLGSTHGQTTLGVV